MPKRTQIAHRNLGKNDKQDIVSENISYRDTLEPIGLQLLLFPRK